MAPVAGLVLNHLHGSRPTARVCLSHSRWQAQRGAGRPPKGNTAGVSHLRRPVLSRHYPLHVTLRIGAGVPSLREGRLFDNVRLALAAGRGSRALRVSARALLRTPWSEPRATRRGSMVYGYWVTRRVLVVFPRMAACDAWSRALSFRDRFDPLARRVPPHLTLVHAFVDALSDGALEDHVQAVAGTINRFSLQLERVFLHEHEYLFLNVTRGGDDLVDARNKLYQGALSRHHARDNTFLPHLTIGRVAPDQLRDALAESSKLTGHIDGHAEAISAYRIDADGSRSVLFNTALR